MHPTADLAIRPAGPEDSDALALVGGATFLDTFAGRIDGGAIVAHCAKQHRAEAYRTALGDGAQAWLVTIEPGGAPVGFALTTAPDLPGSQPDDRELRRIYLLSRYHGSGIAAALLDTVVAGSRGHARLMLGVKNDNHRAIGFYRKHGFEAVGTRSFCVGGRHYDDLVMARPLAS
ncbi:GNAT family N-acetyltransferase [Sphingosinithalassobacter portus]|uniref:GNAT family N-acetyltransferase n=1 Tax=Stakelama portus TaxID=2676234 RepID=UPI000D6E0732|nr:GNAT family N-acetyltransferase [Sphingosinithalassobacter portus]